MKSAEIRLKVKEAHYRDVGRGMARISKAHMKELKISSGDVLLIEGALGKKTTAIAWPAYSSEEKDLMISIDATTRSNAGVRLDELVTIRKASTAAAEKIVFAPTTGNILKGIEGYLHRELQGRAFSLDDKIRLEYMGNLFEYNVLSISPKQDSVFIDQGTVIKITSTSTISEGVSADYKLIPKIAYEDIGGLDDTIQKLREMVELPMRYPELFQRLGVEPPKGVLLYGPPGTGKTLLAKAVANETESHFIDVSGPEVMSVYHGGSEKRIREIFQEAEEKSPSILFIDEIDSISPKRDEKSSGEMERRVVAQMLALMDGLESRGEIIVIGATNRPNAIDPALRRPGRFDREIEIGIPDKNGRLSILEIHTRSMPLADTVNLEDLATRTHGFVGADLLSLTKEAGMHAIRRVFPKIVWGEEISMDIINQILVLPEDFDIALTEVKPSALREVFVEVPTVTWDEVGGLDEIKRELKEIIEWPSKYPMIFNYLEAEIPRGILLTGPPGTGKTLLVRAIASESSKNFIYVKGSEIHSKWVGESEKAIQETFRKARISAPCIVFFDEIDALLPSRTSNVSDSGVTDRIVTTFLTEMDGLEELINVIVIAASNRPDILDTALLRPGRFERVIELPLPDEKAREEILRVHIKNKPISSRVLLSDIANRTNGFSGADLKGIINRATFLSINQFLEKNKEAFDKIPPLERTEFIKDQQLEIKLSHINEALEYYKS
ncbi:MAG: CDC48 family AAA ATPase [Candidatus Heimdallarchaeota archaeon]|nr:MAG: CDC48 family AAA ATPase [Candidatus Heimdallarchaeota archaeon]